MKSEDPAGHVVLLFAPTDANALILNDPQPAGDGFVGEHLEKVRDYPKDTLLILTSQPKNDDALKFIWRIGSCIRKIKVEGNQTPPFTTAGGDYRRIGFSGEVLIVDTVNIVSRVPKGLKNIVGQVLVDLEFHAGTVSEKAT